MVNINLLKQICSFPGAPGFEHAIRSFLKDSLVDYCDDLQIDPMGNLIAFKKVGPIKN